MSLRNSKLVNKAEKPEQGVKNPKNPVNVVYGYPLRIYFGYETFGKK